MLVIPAGPVPAKAGSWNPVVTDMHLGIYPYDELVK